MFDAAVTLKKCQGRWKCNEKVKFNVKYHHAKLAFYYIYGVWENPNIKVFDKPR